MILEKIYLDMQRTEKMILQVSASLLIFSFKVVDINLCFFSIFANNTMFDYKVLIFIYFFDKMNMNEFISILMNKPSKQVFLFLH